MPIFTYAACWPDGLEPVLLAAAAVLNATALWVASRARSTSEDARSMWWSHPANDRRSSNGAVPIERRRGARAPRKS